MTTLDWTVLLHTQFGQTRKVQSALSLPEAPGAVDSRYVKPPSGFAITPEYESALPNRPTCRRCVTSRWLAGVASAVDYYYCSGAPAATCYREYRPSYTVLLHSTTAARYYTRLTALRKFSSLKLLIGPVSNRGVKINCNVAYNIDDKYKRKG